YDGEDIIQQTTTGLVTRYVHGPDIDEALAKADASNTITGYFSADGLGSITRITDAGGNEVKSYEYDPWGNRTESGTLTVDGADYGFAGREWDAETGLYYYRARYYDPKAGRFISEDPIAFLGGINMYAYVRNGPTILVDPSGLLDRSVTL